MYYIHFVVFIVLISIQIVSNYIYLKIYRTILDIHISQKRERKKRKRTCTKKSRKLTTWKETIAGNFCTRVTEVCLCILVMLFCYWQNTLVG